MLFIPELPNSPPLPEYKIISLGFRCSVAGMIKRMGLKTESHPFDWLISRLHVIQDCIETNFNFFLHREQYIKLHTKTFEHKESSERFICDEHIIMNRHYQPETNLAYPMNTYKYNLAMNHRNLVENQDDYDYYIRCVERFKNVIKSRENKMYVYVSPLYTMEDFHVQTDQIMQEIYDFQSFLQKQIVFDESNESIKTEPLQMIRSLYFIMVKNELNNKPHISVLYDNETGSHYKYKILLLQTNDGFIDAGETFMGNYYEEQSIIENNILHFSK